MENIIEDAVSVNPTMDYQPCLYQDTKLKDKKSHVHTERFEDFASNSFKVTISHVQQVALQKAGGRLPTPAEQLALVNKRREKKKVDAMVRSLSWIPILCLHRYMVCQYDLLFWQIDDDLWVDMGSLRKFDLLTKVQVQDGWVVEIRRRLQGRAAGQLYKWFKSVNGEQFWTAYLVLWEI